MEDCAVAACACSLEDFARISRLHGRMLLAGSFYGLAD